MKAVIFKLLPYLATFALMACSTPPPLKQALDTKAIQTVQAEIKRQVGVYMVAAKNHANENPKEFWCGTGDIDFDIATVKAELTTTVETINSGGVKLKIPVHAIQVGLSGSVKRDVTNTEVLDYHLWPLEMSRQPLLMSTQPDLDSAPIAKVLLSLREALIESAKKTAIGPQPCFTDYNPDKPAADAGNTFKLGLSFVNDLTGGFELSVGVLDLTATTESKGTTGNTLTVSFVQRGLAQLQHAKDKVDTQCKYPKDENTKECKEAVEAFKKLQDNTGVSLT
jgi:hypothetical protein